MDPVFGILIRKVGEYGSKLGPGNPQYWLITHLMGWMNLASALAPLPSITLEVRPGKSILALPKPSRCPMFRFFLRSRLLARPRFLPCADTPCIVFHSTDDSGAEVRVRGFNKQ